MCSRSALLKHKVCWLKSWFKLFMHYLWPLCAFVRGSSSHFIITRGNFHCNIMVDISPFVGEHWGRRRLFHIYFSQPHLRCCLFWAIAQTVGCSVGYITLNVSYSLGWHCSLYSVQHNHSLIKKVTKEWRGSPWLPRRRKVEPLFFVFSFHKPLKIFTINITEMTKRSSSTV